MSMEKIVSQVTFSNFKQNMDVDVNYVKNVLGTH